MLTGSCLCGKVGYAAFKPAWYEIADGLPEFDELAPREFYLQSFQRGGS